MDKRIMIMAGGTGGHVFPALAVAQSLREKGWQVSWLGTRKGLESRVVPEQNFEIDWMSVAGLRGKGGIALLTAPLMLVKACWQALIIILRRRPDVVLGMGGFVAGPGGLMGRVLGIPLIIHEQNRIPGTTNRWLAKLANKVLEGFADSFPQQANAIYTGNPLRKEFVVQSELKSNKNDHNDYRILVVGGSLGAQILNETVPEALAGEAAVAVQHQTGAVMLEQVRNHYAALNINADVVAFIEEMVAAYQWADLIICRSGAMTVSEIAAMGLPSIMIPYPYAIDDHQTANANYLVEAKAGSVIQQSDLSADLLAQHIRMHKDNLATLSDAARGCAKMQATKDVVDICIAEAVA
jgi:UDP-N-acetylglucosamine--N-acetylmuramyl-(pentapeptide) pyrophosphoryl-undecaprenol N-acetylglucosamine transferase